MQLICDGLDLCDAVITVSRAISTKTTNPILEGIKIVAEDGIVTLSATDLELSIEKKIKAEVKIEGETVVPGRFFGELIKKLTNERIELKLNDNNSLKIKYTDSETIIQCFPVYEFPCFKKLESNDFFGIEQKNFKNLINKTAFSVAIDDTRPILKGCLFEIENGKIKTVALDGFRLALNSQKIKESNLSASVVVPARSLNEIAKLLDDSDKIINIYFQRNFLMVDLEDCIITTRLLEGEFINYKQIISSEFETKITINKKQLEDALERASLLSKIGQNNLVQFDIRDQNLCITSRSEIGNIKENLSIVFKGKEFVIAFNARYFMEALKVNQEEFINIKFNSAQNPCVITPFDGDQDRYLYLILPVRLMKG
ncbi:MAG: DNA polymerase III subunit beta [Clostridia bacterium]|nr:DNA polymerase III subunit beta [Clostridia bacterium]